MTLTFELDLEIRITAGEKFTICQNIILSNSLLGIHRDRLWGCIQNFCSLL